MLVTPQVEVATLADIPALVQLRLDQGWYPHPALLQVLCEYEGGQIVIVREGSVDPASETPERLIATTCALAAAPVGIIGNVIVREGFRGYGLGRRVMQAAIHWLHSRGVRSVLLDATEDGRPLYYKLGFVAMEISWFGHAAVEALDRVSLRERAGALRVTVRPAEDLALLAKMDRTAFGGDRIGFLAHMLSVPNTWLSVATDMAGTPVGYAFMRCLEARPESVRLGPWVATSENAAAALLSAVSDDDAPWRAIIRERAERVQIFASLGGTNPYALSLFGSAGGRLAQDDLIMQLDLREDGTAATPDEKPRPVAQRPEWLYGWLAPMVF